MTQDVKAQHTPGPWRECRDGDCTCGFIWSADGEIHVATVHGPDALGQDWYGSDVATTDAPANAHLIAAAPDLLEVAQEAAAMFRYYERLHMEKGTVDGDAKARRNAEMAEKCEAAIAKATGEQP